MLGYYIHSGDVETGDLFSPYLWAARGFARIVDEICADVTYGDVLRLLLVQYFVEGRFPTGGPDRARLSNYSNKNKDIAVAFPVTRDKFHDVAEQERRQFIVGTTMQAIDMVEARLSKRKLDIDFEALRRDVRAASEEYLKQPGSLAG